MTIQWQNGGSPECQVSSAGLAIIVNFASMRQYRPGTPTKTRHVLRLVEKSVMWSWRVSQKQLWQFDPAVASSIENAYQQVMSHDFIGISSYTSHCAYFYISIIMARLQRDLGMFLKCRAIIL